MTQPPSQPLAPRDLLVLVALSAGPNHGYGLIKEVEAQSDSSLRLDPANLYRLLRRMRTGGWIVESEGVAEQGSGPARRTYTITENGRGVLATEVRRLETLLQHARGVLAEGEP